MIEELRRLVVARKSLSIVPDWKVTSRMEFVSCVSPIEIGPLTVAGLMFRAQANQFLPDEQVTFQLEYHPEDESSPSGPLVRIEWRPLTRHNNGGLGPDEYRFVQIAGSHIHPFDLNEDWIQDKNARRRLPIAIPIEQDMQNYKAALDFVGKSFMIENIGIVPEPPWSARLI